MRGPDALVALWRRPPGTLAFLDGVRAIAVLWVLAFHFTVPIVADALPVMASFHLLGGPAAAVYARLLRSAALQPILSGDLGVDLFLVLTGFLIGRSLLREHAARGRVDVGRFLGRRWLRIAPAYLVCMAIHAVEPGQRAACLRWGWSNLLFVNNLFGPQVSRRACFGHGWSVALEMQFYVLAPLLVAAVLRRGARVPLALAAVSLACTFAAVAGHAGEPLLDWYADAVYDKLHTRAVPCLLGLAAASLDRTIAQRCAEGRADPLAGHWARAGDLPAIAAVLAVAYLGAGDHVDAFLPGARPFVVGNLLCLLLGRAAFSLGATWLILRMARGGATGLRAFLSLRVWAPVASLSYAAYLVQFIGLVPVWILAAPALGAAASPAAGMGLILALFAGALALVFTLALVLHLLVEAPLMKLLPASRAQPGESGLPPPGVEGKPAKG